MEEYLQSGGSGADPYGTLEMFDTNPDTGKKYTMGQYGCNVYAITNLLTSHGMEVNPGYVHSVYKETGNNANAETMNRILREAGSDERVKTIAVNDTKKYISELLNGRGIATWVGPGPRVDGVNINMYTSKYHWMVVADIRPTRLGDKYGYDVYVLPSGNKGRGWQKIETILDNLNGANSMYISK